GSNNDTKIAVDTTAPENVKVEIDIPAVNPQNFTATSLTLPLKISGEDDVGVIAHCTSLLSDQPDKDHTCWVSLAAPQKTFFAGGIPFVITQNDLPIIQSKNGILEIFAWLKDEAGNISKQTSVTLNVDDTGKEIIKDVLPVDNAISIPADTTILAIFTRKMDATSINDKSFLLTCAGTPVTGKVSYDEATMTATLKPSQHLPYSAYCLATLTQDVKKLNGEKIKGFYSWQFMTIEQAAAPNFTPSSGNYAAKGFTFKINSQSPVAEIYYGHL
ncbi:MAG: Ig-like domain-containing protein, partial [Pseudomonadota bacterium]